MKLDKIKIIWILTMLFAFSCRQKTVESKTSELIDELSWESVSIDCQLFLVMTENDSVSNKLVEIGIYANKQLIKSISIPNKTVPIHIILTRINDQKAYIENGLGTKYTYENCKELVGWHSVFNGITWSWNENQGEYISKSEINKIAEYWHKKMIAGQIAELPKNNLIFDQLEILDNQKYPCVDNRKYENNSANVKFQELKSLLGKSSQSKEVIEFMNRIGNDSIHSYHKDSYFINYDTDGISLKFKEDSTLNHIFLEKEYLGTLWKNLKMDYSKKQIIKALGEPTKIYKYGANSENFWYEENNLSIYFDSKKNIKDVRFGK